MGQVEEKVFIHIIKASIGGYKYDELKLQRIKFKRTLADCAVDGRLPEKNLVTPTQAATEALKWLERLEKGAISTIIRKDINVNLTPMEIEHRIIKYGEFSHLHQRINSENSETTHERLTKNPEEWMEYHRQYRDARKNWMIIPYEEIIKRISELSSRLLIGDFGCGEAKVMEHFGSQRVHSFDHVAINDNVISCDMKKIPLEDNSLDIAIFSLSLMGQNWWDYLDEAKRCLAPNGYLFITETNKSMGEDGRLFRLKDTLEKKGFEIYSQEEKYEFIFIEARKI
jgi:hypothetical protein